MSNHFFGRLISTGCNPVRFQILPESAHKFVHHENTFLTQEFRCQKGREGPSVGGAMNEITIPGQSNNFGNSQHGKPKPAHKRWNANPNDLEIIFFLHSRYAPVCSGGDDNTLVPITGESFRNLLHKNFPAPNVRWVKLYHKTYFHR